MQWTVVFTGRAKKQKAKLPLRVQEALFQLVREIEAGGPVRGDWPNYSKLSAFEHHCHLEKGNPCYVAVWSVEKDKVRFVEVIYVGTHEKAPY
jgi:hypothetical protein